MAMNMKITVILDVMPCSLVVRSHVLEEPPKLL